MMKLYCYKLYDKDENITDVYHTVAKDNKEVHAMLDAHMKHIENAGLSDTYYSYSFFEVHDIDGYSVDLSNKSTVLRVENNEKLEVLR